MMKKQKKEEKKLNASENIQPRDFFILYFIFFKGTLKLVSSSFFVVFCSVSVSPYINTIDITHTFTLIGRDKLCLYDGRNLWGVIGNKIETRVVSGKTYF